MDIHISLNNHPKKETIYLSIINLRKTTNVDPPFVDEIESPSQIEVSILRYFVQTIITRTSANLLICKDFYGKHLL